MIYVAEIGTDGPVKIGRGKNAMERVRAIQTACPYRLEYRTHADWPDAIEGQIHEYLKDERIKGEWFHNTKKVERIAHIIDRGDLQELMALIWPKEAEKAKGETPLDQPAIPVVEVKASIGVDRPERRSRHGEYADKESRVRYMRNLMAIKRQTPRAVIEGLAEFLKGD